MWGAAGRGERARRSGREEADHRVAPLHFAPNDAERFPEAGLHHAATVVPAAALLLDVATGGEFYRALLQQRLERRVKSGRAEGVAGAVGSSSFDAVLPSLHGAVDDRRRLAVAEVRGRVLCGHHVRDVVSRGHVDDVPVVEIGEFDRIPLNVLARRSVVAADPVRIDRSLVPVDVEEEIVERGGPGGGQRLRHTARRESPFALDHVDARGVGSVDVARSPGVAEG